MAKLVRDLVPEIIRSAGGDPCVRPARPPEHILLLKRKLVEEAQEVLSASDRAGVLEELADVWEVCQSLAAALELSVADIERVRAEKRRTRGGFERALVLEEPSSERL
jgi:predicted house-cleaning noncanonical NTP pyrophosphatase (MazG superfamily)